ncbi:MAG: hypothetical protein IMF19_06925, partial [Proteobacteria bacterium]|nr:hypothetical protein [Pseudomonadota bacterium]
MSDKNNNKRSSGEIQFYLQCISAEDSLLQSYRMLFIAIEAVLFGWAYVLSPTKNIGGLPITACAGIAFCLVWMAVCIHRACIIDRLKDELKQLLAKGNSTDLKGWFNLSYGEASTTECNIRKFKNLYRSLFGKPFGKPHEKCIPRVTFNLVSPVGMIILWVLVLKKKLLYTTMADIPNFSPNLNFSFPQLPGWQYPFYAIAVIFIGWVITYYFYPKFSHKLALRRTLATTYLIPFMEWCHSLYKEITEFKQRYIDENDEKLSKTLVIIDHRELHDVLREQGKYIGIIEKENPMVANYLRNLE